MTLSVNDIKAHLRQIEITSGKSVHDLLKAVFVDRDWTNTLGLDATAAELNRSSDVSSRIVDLSADTTISAATHEGKMLTLSGSGAAKTMTLPAASGSGAIYRFVVTTVNTSNHVITAATNSGAFYGSLRILDKDGTADSAFHVAGGSSADVITLNGTTTGGLVGDTVTVMDIATNKWAVWGSLGCPAGSNPATMFS